MRWSAALLARDVRACRTSGRARRRQRRDACVLSPRALVKDSCSGTRAFACAVRLSLSPLRSSTESIRATSSFAAHLCAWLAGISRGGCPPRRSRRLALLALLPFTASLPRFANLPSLVALRLSRQLPISLAPTHLCLSTQSLEAACAGVRARPKYPPSHACARWCDEVCDGDDALRGKETSTGRQRPAAARQLLLRTRTARRAGRSGLSHAAHMGALTHRRRLETIDAPQVARRLLDMELCAASATAYPHLGSGATHLPLVAAVLDPGVELAAGRQQQCASDDVPPPLTLAQSESVPRGLRSPTI
jgi:hypothetical protein